VLVQKATPVTRYQGGEIGTGGSELGEGEGGGGRGRGTGNGTGAGVGGGGKGWKGRGGGEGGESVWQHPELVIGVRETESSSSLSLPPPSHSSYLLSPSLSRESCMRGAGGHQLFVSPTYRTGGGGGGAGGGGGILNIGTPTVTRAQEKSQEVTNPLWTVEVTSPSQGRSPSSLVRLVRAGERDTRGDEEEAASSRTRSPIGVPARCLRPESSCVSPGVSPGVEVVSCDRDNDVRLNARAPAPFHSESFVRLVRERERGEARGSLEAEGGFGRDTTAHGSGKESAGRWVEEGERDREEGGRGRGTRGGEGRETCWENAEMLQEMKVCLEQLVRARAQVRVHQFAVICVYLCVCVCVCEGVCVLCHMCFLVCKFLCQCVFCAFGSKT
jgi:hypothetical protein